MRIEYAEESYFFDFRGFAQERKEIHAWTLKKGFLQRTHIKESIKEEYSENPTDKTELQTYCKYSAPKIPIKDSWK